MGGGLGEGAVGLTDLAVRWACVKAPAVIILHEAAVSVETSAADELSGHREINHDCVPWCINHVTVRPPVLHVETWSNRLLTP